MKIEYSGFLKLVIKKKKNNLYEVLLEQIKKIRDFKSIFDLFPLEKIDENFTNLINKKLKILLCTILYEKEENNKILFKILKNILQINNNNSLDLVFPIEIVKLNFDFTSKYYFYLLEDKEIYNIVMNVKELIISFFINQIDKGYADSESLISLLTLSPNYNFSIYLLNQINYMLIDENDFYQKESNPNFLFFAKFFEKCKDLIENENVSKGKYLFESVKLKYRILNDLKTCQIPFNRIDNLIDINIDVEKKEFELDKNNFYNKILVITDKNEKESKEIYNKLKEYLEKAKKKIAIFQDIENYYNTFYPNSKKDIINEIKKQLYSIKQTNLDEIINLNEYDLIKDEFDLNKSIEESKNLKYSKSFFFMTIYREKAKNLKSEDETFIDSLNTYRNIITRIINQKDSKQPFFEIDYIKEIMRAIQDSENQLEEEINFIKDEFEDLNKEDYIKNDLLNDLINFSLRDKIKILLKGIIYFIEAYNKINKLIITDFLNNLKNTYERINSDEVNGDEIKEAITLLKKYDYDAKKEAPLNRIVEIANYDY